MIPGHFFFVAQPSVCIFQQNGLILPSCFACCTNSEGDKPKVSVRCEGRTQIWPSLLKSQRLEGKKNKLKRFLGSYYMIITITLRCFAKQEEEEKRNTNR